MHNIETLHVMPQMIRVEGVIDGDGGYEYPEKFQNNVFVINDKIVFFEKRKYQEYPFTLINALIQSISKSFISNNVLDEFKESLIEQISDFISSNSNDIDIRNALVSLEKNSLEQIEELKSELLDISKNTKKYAEDTLNTELELVYKNFETAIANIVKEEVNKIKSEIIINDNKLKPGQIMLYKEMGMELDDIIRLKKENIL